MLNLSVYNPPKRYDIETKYLYLQFKIYISNVNCRKTQNRQRHSNMGNKELMAGFGKFQYIKFLYDILFEEFKLTFSIHLNMPHLIYWLL